MGLQNVQPNENFMGLQNVQPNENFMGLQNVRACVCVVFFQFCDVAQVVVIHK
jgi:hypothetical protein